MDLNGTKKWRCPMVPNKTVTQQKVTGGVSSPTPTLVLWWWWRYDFACIPRRMTKIASQQRRGLLLLL